MIPAARLVPSLAFALAALLPLRAAPALVLTPAGVTCRPGEVRSLTLGLPALDGRGTHAAPLKDGLATDGRTLSARFGPPFDNVTLSVRVLDDQHVEYIYDNLPADARLVMCQFNLPRSLITPGVNIAFDQHTPVSIPAVPGKTNASVRLADANARTMTLRWPDGETLALATPVPCWHGIQDARVWGKDYVGLCLTPPLRRATPDATRATFVLTFTFAPALASP